MSDFQGSDASRAGGKARTLRDGRYRILGVLGTGAQARTFDAQDEHAGTRVAVKCFSVRGAKSWKDVELAEREARVLSTLQHPNLPRYLDHFEENGELYLVMERVEGRTLAELSRAGALSQVDIRRFLEDAAAVLSYLKARAPPIIHRDIKPENVIQRPNGSYAIVDFGSVRDSLRMEGGSTVVGTFGYMAPEQFQGRALPGTDVYGVGATALSCLTRQPPEKLPHRGLAIDVEAALGGRVDPHFVELLKRLLEPDPDRRAQDLATALREVGSFEAGSRPTPRNRAAADSNVRSPRKRRERPRERRREARLSRHPRGAGLSSLILTVLLLALFVARLLSFAVFRVLLPTLLGVLAMVLGPSLRRLAHRCGHLGVAAERALEHAVHDVRGWSLLSEQQRVESPRVRVAPEAEEPLGDPEPEDEGSQAERSREHKPR